MNSAFLEFADRFDPDELQDGFNRTMGKKLFSFMSKMKYWQLYCDLYPIITEKGGGRFPQMFAEEFVKAYERQVAEYHRHDRDGTTTKSANDANESAVDPGLQETQKLDPSQIPVESAFEEDDVIDALSESGASEIDHSFIDELEDSMAEEISQDQIKA
jgi:hypothetical protein